MHTVEFIAAERGDNVIISFAIADATGLGGVRTLSLIWTPKFDFLLPPEERGVGVFFERLPNDKKDFAVTAVYSRTERTVRVTTRQRAYDLDVRKVELDDLAAMHRTFRRMSRLGGLSYERL